MNTTRHRTTRTGLLVFVAASLFSAPLGATDGTILINQARAMAGNVTPGDAPGFPVTISRPGSYRLSGNLTVPHADTHAIVVTAATLLDGANVTLDLNGFSILGPNRCELTITQIATLSCTNAGSGHGIDATHTFNSVIVMNGTIRGMGGTAISIVNPIDIASRIERMTLSHNGGAGIEIDRGLVINNTVGSNGQGGIAITVGLVQGNVIVGNGGAGLHLGPVATFTDNVISTRGIQGSSAVIATVTSLGQNLCDGFAC